MRRFWYCTEVTNRRLSFITMTYVDICSFLFDILKFGEQVEIVFLNLNFPLCKIESTVTFKLFSEAKSSTYNFCWRKRFSTFGH